MEAKQTIAVFGASGSTGSAITKSIAKGTYSLLPMSNDAEKLQKLQSDILKESVKNQKTKTENCSMCAPPQAKPQKTFITHRMQGVVVHVFVYQ